MLTSRRIHSPIFVLLHSSIFFWKFSFCSTGKIIFQSMSRKNPSQKGTFSTAFHKRVKILHKMTVAHRQIHQHCQGSEDHKHSHAVSDLGASGNQTLHSPRNYIISSTQTKTALQPCKISCLSIRQSLEFEIIRFCCFMFLTAQMHYVFLTL